MRAAAGPSTPTPACSAASWDAALLAAGAGLTSIAALDAGEGDGGVLRGAAARPPRHADRAPWASASSTTWRSPPPALADRGERVLIVDYDAHHGNGTQDVFYARPARALRVAARVAALPGHRARSTRPGAGDGVGTTLNVPLPAGRHRRRLPRRPSTTWSAPLVAAFEPDVAARLGRLRRPPSRPDHRPRPHRRATSPTSPRGCCRVRRRPAGGCCFLEGGYDLEALADSARRALAALAAGQLPPEAPTSGRPRPRRGRRGARAAAEARAVGHRFVTPRAPGPAPCRGPRPRSHPCSTRRAPARRARSRRGPRASTWSAASSATCCSSRDAAARPTSTSPPTPARRRPSGSSPAGPTRCGPRASGSARSAPAGRAAPSRSPPTGPRPTSPTRASPTSSSPTTIEADLSRRDFTVNAMALRCPSPSSIDPFDGAADLAARRLRTPLTRRGSFSDDPLRMLRAARFIAGYGLEPDPDAGRRGRARCATGSRSCRPSASATSSTSCIVVDDPRPGCGSWSTPG